MCKLFVIKVEGFIYKDRARVVTVLESSDWSVLGECFLKKKLNDFWRKKKGDLSNKF